MTEEQKQICVKLHGVRVLPGTFDKRFIKSLYSLVATKPDSPLSDSQNEWMFRLLYKYRKQLPVTYDRHKANPLCTQIQKL